MFAGKVECERSKPSIREDSYLEYLGWKILFGIDTQDICPECIEFGKSKIDLYERLFRLIDNAPNDRVDSPNTGKTEATRWTD